MTEIEKAVLALAAPLLAQAWTSEIAPAIQAKLQSGSPEIQIVESALMALLNQVVPAELAKLSAVAGV